MLSLGSVITYSYNESKALKHGACILITAALFLQFLGGYWSGQLGLRWWWLIITIWFIWKMWKYLTYDNIGAKVSGEHLPVRIIITLVPTSIFLLIFLLGYFAGPRGWWWLCLPLVFIYTNLYKVVQKARQSSTH